MVSLIAAILSKWNLLQVQIKLPKVRVNLHIDDNADGLPDQI